MSLAHDIHAAEAGIHAVLFAASEAGRAKAQQLRQASEDNAVSAVDRLGQALLAARRREAALRAEVAQLRTALASERARPRAMDWGQGLGRRA